MAHGLGLGLVNMQPVVHDSIDMKSEESQSLPFEWWSSSLLHVWLPKLIASAPSIVYSTKYESVIDEIDKSHSINLIYALAWIGYLNNCQDSS